MILSHKDNKVAGAVVHNQKLHYPNGFTQQTLRGSVLFNDLDQFFGRDDLNQVELTRFSHQLLVKTIKDAAGTASFIKEHLANHNGPLTSVGQRCAIQLLDAAWRLVDGQPDRQGAVAAEREWLALRFGELPAVLLYRGAEAMLSERREEAYSFYTRAAAEAGEAGLPRMYVGAYSVRGTDASDWTEGGPKNIIASDAQITWVREPLERGRICLLVASDDKYFLKFAKFFHDSLRAKDHESQIHFHVVNWTDECAAVLDNGDRRLSISHEPFKYVKDYTYFASVRFFRARQIMERLGVPLYITDIDNAFRAPPSQITEELCAHDVGFRMVRTARWFPWWGPSAGNTWLNCNENGMKAAEWLRDYIGSRMVVNQAAKTWWFDQFALNEIQHHARKSGFSLADLGAPHLHVSTVRPSSEVAHLKSK